MKISCISDMHLDLGSDPDKAARPIGKLDFDGDLLIAAGDITSNLWHTKDWAEEQSRMSGKPVLWVAGNHEFYRGGHTIDDANGRMAGAEGYLPNATWSAGNTAIIGLTGWYSLDYYGVYPATYEATRKKNRDIDEWMLHNNDSRYIMADEEFHLIPHLVRIYAERHARLLLRELEQIGGNETPMNVVIVTHTVPHRAIIERGAYSSWRGHGGFWNSWMEFDVVNWIAKNRWKFGNVVWVFGHTHDAHDFIHKPSNIHFVCNSALLHNGWNGMAATFTI